MQSALNLTDDEVAEAGRLLRLARTGKVFSPGFEQFETSEYRDEVQEMVQVLIAICQVVDNRKEKEIG